MRDWLGLIGRQRDRVFDEFLRQTVAMRFARRIISALIMTIAARRNQRKGRGLAAPRRWRPVRIPPHDGGAE